MERQRLDTTSFFRESTTDDMSLTIGTVSSDLIVCKKSKRNLTCNRNQIDITPDNDSEQLSLSKSHQSQSTQSQTKICKMEALIHKISATFFNLKQNIAMCKISEHLPITLKMSLFFSWYRTSKIGVTECGLKFPEKHNKGK